MQISTVVTFVLNYFLENVSWFYPWGFQRLTGQSLYLNFFSLFLNNMDLN